MVGRYVIYGEIARGGMATVHLGRLLGPVGFTRTVAVKRLHPQLATDDEFVAMFLDEARLAARVQHPNVVPTIDVVSADSELLVVMEYVQGESLSRLLAALARAGQGMPLRVAGTIMVSLLAGLHAAHEAKNERGEPLGIVHRDVSPQNVLVGADGVVRVFDFGVAKALGRAQTTREGLFKGKVAYAAPEQLTGGELDRRVDIYAASVVLWEMLTGRRLFKAETELALFNMVREGRVDPPSRYVPGLAGAIDEVVMRGLAFDPDKRFQTAQEMAVAIESVLPQGFTRELREWVHETAPEPLKQRARMIAELETPTALLLPERPPSGSDRPPAGLTSGPLSAAVAAGTHEGSGSKTRVALLAVLALLMVGAVGALFVVLGSGRGAAQPPSSTTEKATNESRKPTDTTAVGGPATAPTVGGPATAPMVEPTEASSGAPAPSAQKPPATAVTPHPPAKPSTAGADAAPPATASGSAAPQKPPSTSCSPPYTIDSEGIRHPKPECL